MTADLPQSGVLVREAQPGDLPQVQRLGSHIFSATFGHSVPPSQLQAYLDEHYSLDSIQRDFTNPEKKLLVAVESKQGGVIVGFALLNSGSSEPCVENIEGKIELQRIYVGLEHHGRRIGRQLSDRVEDVAREAGFKVVWLGVWEENYKAQKVYGRLGYMVVGEHDFAIGEIMQTDWIMMKQLR